MAGAAGSLAGPLLKDVDFESKLIATSVVGGAASVAGGGKFANGAITAAFGSLFNEAGRAPNERHRQGVEAAAQGYRNNGYVIEDAFLVDVPGLGERVYDFIATDPPAGVSALR